MPLALRRYASRRAPARNFTPTHIRVFIPNFGIGETVADLLRIETRVDVRRLKEIIYDEV